MSDVAELLNVSGNILHVLESPHAPVSFNAGDRLPPFLFPAAGWRSNIIASSTTLSHMSLFLEPGIEGMNRYPPRSLKKERERENLSFGPKNK